jgi:hypothetical protein
MNEKSLYYFECDEAMDYWLEITYKLKFLCAFYGQTHPRVSIKYNSRHTAESFLKGQHSCGSHKILHMF